MLLHKDRNAVKLDPGSRVGKQPSESYFCSPTDYCDSWTLSVGHLGHQAGIYVNCELDNVSVFQTLVGHMREGNHQVPATHTRPAPNRASMLVVAWR